MSDRINLQHLKALVRAPHGALAFRFYLPIRYRTILYNKAFDGFAVNMRRIAEILSAVDKKLELERRRKEKLERVKKGPMNELLTGRKRVKIEGI